MPNVTASCTLHGRELTGVPVINPGAWFGHAYLLSHGDADPDFFIVEADCVSDAIDEFSDSEWGHLIHVREEDLGDYPEDERRGDGNGRVIDDQNVMVYGPEGGEKGFPCLYHVEGYPVPVSPKTYADHDFEEILRVRNEAKSIVKGPGKYEGEALYVPRMWEDVEAGEGDLWHAYPDEFDRVCFPEIVDEVVVMVEREDGFVVEVS